jgi:signal transduction histidine kinase
MGETTSVADLAVQHDKAAPNDALLWHSLLLGERLHFFARLRLVAALGIFLGVLFAAYVVGIVGLNIWALGACAAFLAMYDVVVLSAVRPYRQPEQAVGGYPRLVFIAHATIVLDYLVLTCAIWLVGGSQSPFLAFYLLHAILASVLLSRRAAFAHELVGYLLLASLVVGEWSGAIPRHRPIGAVPGGLDTDYRLMLTVLFVYGLLTAVATLLMTGIARLLRDGERRLRAASEDLEKLANLRRAFLHVVLHDLRSPVATVVTLLDNLAIELGGPLNATQADWVRRADKRLRDLLELLRDLQTLAELETGRIDAIMEHVDVAKLVKTTVEDHADPAEQRGVRLATELPERLPMVNGVGRLLREAIANYLTNAIKYTPAGGSIVVRASVSGTGVRIEVSDDGPGISPADQARLFQEFARVGRAREAGRAVPGTGLGLSIVRRIAEAHGGRVGVESDVGKGSRFFLEIPALPEGSAPAVRQG